MKPPTTIPIGSGLILPLQPEVGSGYEISTKIREKPGMVVQQSQPLGRWGRITGRDSGLFITINQVLE
jgi:hypothetical protein